ncbi:MAG: hypothetical protein MUF23_04770 [Pirellula sp.]|jgi:hypothetical protein|nr:hypothetical protein [Pirellula sp.]
MQNATSSWFASARRLFGSERTNRRSNAKSRRLLFENLERREVFSTDFLSAFAIGGETGNAIVNQVISDSTGNTYHRGNFSGTIDLDPAATYPDDKDILTAASTTGYIAKYAPDNSLL